MQSGSTSTATGAALFEVALVGAFVADGEFTGETAKRSTVRSVVIMSGCPLW